MCYGRSSQTVRMRNKSIGSGLNFGASVIRDTLMLRFVIQIDIRGAILLNTKAICHIHLQLWQVFAMNFQNQRYHPVPAQEEVYTGTMFSLRLRYSNCFTNVIFRRSEQYVLIVMDFLRSLHLGGLNYHRIGIL